MDEDAPNESGLYASDLVGMSWHFARSNLRELGAIAVVPAFLSLLIRFCTGTFESTEPEYSAIQPIVSILETVPWTLFGIALHRRILLNEPATIRSATSWSNSHTAFAGFLIFWQLPILFLPKPGAASSFLGAWIVGLVILGLLLAVLQARFAIFLPAIAVGDPLSPAAAWRRSTGYVGAICWAGFFSGCLSTILVSPLYLVTIFLAPDSSTMKIFISIPATLIFEALAVGALSFAYRRILTDAAAT